VGGQALVGRKGGKRGRRLGGGAAAGAGGAPLGSHLLTSSQPSRHAPPQAIAHDSAASSTNSVACSVLSVRIEGGVTSGAAAAAPPPPPPARALPPPAPPLPVTSLAVACEKRLRLPVSPAS
jgi:hypothetical protein